jgi:AhpD family alkylhydroperoxidase
MRHDGPAAGRRRGPGPGEEACVGDEPTGSLEAFRHFREKANAAILATDNLTLKRFFALDTRAYEAGALPARTKELLGLVASLVLRCDDCVTYHLVRCREEGVSDAEILDAASVALVVGGSIVIPHLRRAVARLDELPPAAPAAAAP